MIDAPIPRNKDKQPNEWVLDDVVVTCELVYLHHSKHSMTSIDQPGHEACMLVAALK